MKKCILESKSWAAATAMGKANLSFLGFSSCVYKIKRICGFAEPYIITRKKFYALINAWLPSSTTWLALAGSLMHAQQRHTAVIIVLAAHLFCAYPFSPTCTIWFHSGSQFSPLFTFVGGILHRLWSIVSPIIHPFFELHRDHNNHHHPARICLILCL